jgi:hypothetical protein
MTLISRKYIDDNDIIARYLANGLSEAERESFEGYYLEHPELLKELNRTAQFKSGLIDLNESGSLKGLLKPQPRWQHPFRLAIAASLALAILGASIWYNWQNNSRPILASTAAALSHGFESRLPIAESLSIQRTRTSSYDATINLPVGAAAIELRVRPEVPALPALYRVNLARMSADNSLTNVAEVNALQVATDGFVVIYLNATALSPAIYEIKISGDKDASHAKTESSFLVEVLAAIDK